MKLVLKENEELVMSSLELADITGKRHSDVMRDIRDETEKLEGVAESIFALSEYKDSSGKKNPAPFYKKN